ncbi:putative N-acetyltransferase HLS1-like [Vitis vinifera]|uniref:Putative N-acetyltransferase HLS1-like n=1 Tax=Vitis vinifera TaxID=29760 RepID=A0A438GCV1_VITVI|nr:putative N-acetyltransferase HLS1-like [Vitis vinifera]
MVEGSKESALGFMSEAAVASVLEVFRPFGLHFKYGLGGEGPRKVKLVKALCGYAHNLAKERGCEVVATEMSSRKPLKIRNPTLEEVILCQGPILGYKRSKSNQYPNTSLIQIEGVVMRQENGLSKAKVKKNEITAPHTGRKTGLRRQWKLVGGQKKLPRSSTRQCVS